MNQEPSVPTLVPAFDVAVTLGELQDHGQTRVGRRRVIPIMGGVISGEIDGRYCARTASGEYLYLRVSGVRSGSPDVLESLLAGEAVSPDEYYFRTSLTIETSAPELAHLEHSLFVASCVREATTVRYRAYRVT